VQRKRGAFPAPGSCARLKPSRLTAGNSGVVEATGVLLENFPVI
jgi:hypothetical protein